MPTLKLIRSYPEAVARAQALANKTGKPLAVTCVRKGYVIAVPRVHQFFDIVKPEVDA